MKHLIKIMVARYVYAEFAGCISTNVFVSCRITPISEIYRICMFLW